jgi:UDP-2,4-diacetamido-2,4,6-trideoxy-beta-L-altropyranose hydrolase
MNFVFRVDSSIRIGTGHIMRCLTLAEELRRRGAQVRFVCREQAGSPVVILRQRGMPVTPLPPPRIVDNDPSENYAAWLGATQAEDAEQTITALAGEQPDWLVIDHYGIDIQWEQSLRPHVHKVMVIDDLANRRHDSDVLLDQNYSTEGGRRYFNLVPETCTRLIGPRYALLRPEYAAYRKTMRPRDGQVDRVLVFLGGSDPQNLTGMALEALSQSELSHLAVDVVVGANNIYKDSIARQAMHRPLTTLHGSLPHLADLMSQADLAIGAGGATTWERMCLGLATVVITNAENQRSVSEALAEAQLINYPGHFSDIDSVRLTQVLRQLVCGSGEPAAQSVRSQLLVDGLGALRVAEVLSPTAMQDVRLGTASEQDIGLYFNWANDPVVRNSAVNSSTISWPSHQAWFTDKLQDPNCWLFILEAAGLPVGQIRFEIAEKVANIDYSLDPIVRGRGWGRRLVAMGSSLMQQMEPLRLYAKVKVTNDASRAVFASLGFMETASSAGEEYKSFYRDPVGTNGISTEYGRQLPLHRVT